MVYITSYVISRFLRRADCDGAGRRCADLGFGATYIYIYIYIYI